MKKSLLLLTGKVRTMAPEDMNRTIVHILNSKMYNNLGQYTDEEIEYRLKNYAKFVIVRDPLERTVSAYQDKFVYTTNNHWRYTYGRGIVKQYRKNATASEIRHGRIHFDEFFKFVINQNFSNQVEMHWNSYYNLCQPCAVRYDVIAKYNTFKYDIKYLFDKLKIHGFEFPYIRDYNGTATKLLVPDIIKKISKNDLKKFTDTYSMDFKLFGYDKPNIVK